MDLSEYAFTQETFWSSVILAPEPELNISLVVSFAYGYAKQIGNVILRKRSYTSTEVCELELIDLVDNGSDLFIEPSGSNFS